MITHRTKTDNWMVIPPVPVTSKVVEKELASESFSTIAARYFRVSVGSGPQPIDFYDRPYDTVMLDYDAPEVLYMTGRQTGKSTKLCLNNVIQCLSSPGYRTMYIAPRGDQVKVFSRDVYALMCTMSPMVSNMIDEANTWQQGVRAFKNASLTYFRSAFHSADPARGISAGWISFDEFQDLIADQIPILTKSALNYKDSRFFYTGTPKTFSNHLSEYFDESSGFEWLVKCHGCLHWNFLDLSVIGPEFYMCQKCHRKIDLILDGQWVPRKPKQVGIFNGYRLPTILNPNVTHAEIYAELHSPRTTVSAFCNEVMGLPFAEGDLALSVGDMKAACESKRRMARLGERIPFQVVAGIDWGTGSMSAVTKKGERTKSFTVITIGGFYRGKFRVMYQKRLLGADAELSRQPEALNRIMRQFGVTIVVADWGFGAPMNARMINEFDWGTDQFFECQYSMQKAMVNWNKQADRFMADRSALHMKLIDDIKHRRVLFPRWEDMDKYVDDYTSIFVEYDADRNVIKFDHPVGKPDDCFQSTVYCRMASDIVNGLLNRYATQPMYS